MHLLRIISILSWMCVQVRSKAVFAHFMVGNTGSYSEKEWKDDIMLAQAANIDAFALNMATNEIFKDSLSNAFSIAKDVNFKLFFSFDYAGNGSWPRQEVINLLGQYKDHPAYYRQGGKPFVSTFEGAQNATDWHKIKNEIDCFFVPDWTSVGPRQAANHSVVDGLFSWNAWPEGPRSINTTADKEYINSLDGRPYMMPVSPWFYTNMPGFDKNWVWRGDNLWHERWQQVIDLKPEFVQIISWNDYGESHYIGPLRNDGYVAFGPSRGNAPFNYAQKMSHDAWRTLLPYYINQYKSTNEEVTLTIENETAVAWYRLHPAKACRTGGTTGNAPNQGQREYPPSTILEDRIFYSAALNSTSEVTLKVGDSQLTGKWDHAPNGGKGVYHGSIPFEGTGIVQVLISRRGKTVATVEGEPITSDCSSSGGIQNYNAWVGQSAAVHIQFPWQLVGFLVAVWAIKMQ
ncbi:glycoside hydrolase [Aspergillus ambiguus]|uniref:glycoside hydrolase family 71 protein n=1 Tax=Aspergillus ambiguus TaxID=176160 RepID=UPI003CCCD968